MHTKNKQAISTQEDSYVEQYQSPRSKVQPFNLCLKL